jgi:hypothetical protein
MSTTRKTSKPQNTPILLIFVAAIAHKSNAFRLVGSSGSSDVTFLRTLMLNIRQHRAREEITKERKGKTLTKAYATAIPNTSTAYAASRCAAAEEEATSALTPYCACSCLHLDCHWSSYWAVANTLAALDTTYRVSSPASPPRRGDCARLEGGRRIWIRQCWRGYQLDSR